MMFFQDAQFPKCAHAIRSRILGGKLPEHVLIALQDSIDNERLVKSALSPGTYPRVVIQKGETAGPMGGRAIPGWYDGEKKPALLNMVFINLWVANDAERFGAVDEFVRVVLHEVVHWGRHIAGKPGRIRIEGVDREAGDVFEFWAGFTWSLMDHHEIPSS